ncbi:MAG: hypothetical protein JOZ78_17785 [Chroococcidiopsidaceae cyanobacterium CP_BM_ER_R8_30]|nr:hypothetical protein [Chroococcidiopsidaceae cyanobacterium CP_BM_ER_R8_30]
MSQHSQVLNKSIFAELPYVKADLTYIVRPKEKPINYAYIPASATPQRSATPDVHTVPIFDGRSIASEFSPDREGFALADYQTAVQDFYDDDEVQRVYYPEAEQFVKEQTDAVRVVVFDHVVRNAQRSQPGINTIREPGKRVHNDYTANSGYSRGRWVLNRIGEDNPDALLKNRFGIINVWRAIASPIQESPLAVCDARSIAPTDWVASDLVYPDRVGETYGVTYNSDHQWFYFPLMHRDQALLIKCFDSEEDGRARFSAHSAFDDPTSLADAPARESIELRTLVFYE